jgi:HK97 family phage major capsid protein
MASPLQEAREQLAAKTQQARTIINNPNATAAEVKTAQDLVQKEIPAIKADIELLSSTDALKSALDGFDSWANDPVGGSANQAQIAGFKAAGYSEFIQDGKKSVLYSEGEGLMTPAQIKTIQDPEYAQAFKSYCRAKGDVNKMSGAAMKTLSGGIDEDGGFLVPAEVLERIIERKPTPTRIAGLTTGLTTSRTP